MSHLVCSLEPSAGTPGYVWVWRSTKRQHGGPRPLRWAEPHYSRHDATLHGLQAGAQAGGRVRCTAWEHGPRRRRHRPLRSRAAGCRRQPKPRTRRPHTPSPPLGSPEGPYLRSAYRVRVTPARQNPSKNLSVLNMVTFTDSATVSPKMRMKMMEKSSTGRRPNLHTDRDTVSHRRTGRASPGASGAGWGPHGVCIPPGPSWGGPGAGGPQGTHTHPSSCR